MREIDITDYCLDFIENQGKRVSDKFFQLVVIMEEVKIVHANFVKKSNKDYLKAIKGAEKILEEYMKNEAL